MRRDYPGGCGPRASWPSHPSTPGLTCEAAAVLRLVTIPISPFCEKARWALDRAGLAYREERHVQGPSVVAARLAGGGLTTPVLVAPDCVLGESEDILRYADRSLPAADRLFPGDPAVLADAEALSRRLNTELGPQTRRIAYARPAPGQGRPAQDEQRRVPDSESAAVRATSQSRRAPITVRMVSPPAAA